MTNIKHEKGLLYCDSPAHEVRSRLSWSVLSQPSFLCGSDCSRTTRWSISHGTRPPCRYDSKASASAWELDPYSFTAWLLMSDRIRLLLLLVPPLPTGAHKIICRGLNRATQQPTRCLTLLFEMHRPLIWRKQTFPYPWHTPLPPTPPPVVNLFMSCCPDIS